MCCRRVRRRRKRGAQGGGGAVFTNDASMSTKVSPSARQSPCWPSTSACGGSQRYTSQQLRGGRAGANGLARFVQPGYARCRLRSGGHGGQFRRQGVWHWDCTRCRWRTHRTALPRPGGPLGLFATALEVSAMVSRYVPPAQQRSGPQLSARRWAANKL